MGVDVDGIISLVLRVYPAPRIVTEFSYNKYGVMTGQLRELRSRKWKFCEVDIFFC